MKDWIGDAVGACIGLIALLLGALWNAHLSRNREKEMHQDEVKSVASAIGAEMDAILAYNMGKLSQLEHTDVARSSHFFVALEPAEPIVWPRVCDKIGWLEAELGYDVVNAWARIGLHIGLHKASLEEARHGILDRGAYLNRCRLMAMDHGFIQGVITRLTGRPAKGLMLPMRLEAEMHQKAMQAD